MSPLIIQAAFTYLILWKLLLQLIARANKYFSHQHWIFTSISGNCWNSALYSRGHTYLKESSSSSIRKLSKLYYYFFRPLWNMVVQCSGCQNHNSWTDYPRSACVFVCVCVSMCMGEDSGFFGLDMGDGSTLSCNIQVYACWLGGRSKVCVPLNNSSTLFSMFLGFPAKHHTLFYSWTWMTEKIMSVVFIGKKMTYWEVEYFSAYGTELLFAVESWRCFIFIRWPLEAITLWRRRLDLLVKLQLLHS